MCAGGQGRDWYKVLREQVADLRTQNEGFGFRGAEVNGVCLADIFDVMDAVGTATLTD